LARGQETLSALSSPPGELVSEANDNSVTIVLIYGTARILLAGDAEAKEEEYMASGTYATVPRPD
jgi:competence protein ComEC